MTEDIKHTVGDLKRERNLYKGKYRSMVALMEKARSEIRQISDHTEDEGDRAYFGSTNHADQLRDLADSMESWLLDFDLPKGDINKMEKDPYAEIRAMRERIAELEKENARLRSEFYDVVSTTETDSDGNHIEKPVSKVELLQAAIASEKEAHVRACEERERIRNKYMDTKCPRPCGNRSDDFTKGECVAAEECGCGASAAMEVSRG